MNIGTKEWVRVMTELANDQKLRGCFPKLTARRGNKKFITTEQLIKSLYEELTQNGQTLNSSK